MISIVITSFKEPLTIGKAIDAFASQKISQKYELIVAAPDAETLNAAKKAAKNLKNIKIVRDPGKGKSFAINWLLPKLKGDIAVLSDGDVYVSEDSVNRLIEPFENPEIGCVSGRPVSANPRESKFGYWSHLLVDAGAHEARLRRAKKGRFLECSAYLWAFRKNAINDFPTDVAEDTIVPILFMLKGYKIAYSPKSIVYVKYPDNMKDFIAQKIRTVKSHETLSKYFRKIPRMKTFFNEIAEGWTALLYPRSVKEFFWTLELLPVRLYIWLAAFWAIRKGKVYSDAWQRIESTK